MSDWTRAVRAQLIAESGARHELMDCAADCVARFVGYPPRGAARYTLALRLRDAPSTVYVLAEHVVRFAHEYDVACRQLPGLEADIVLLRGNGRALDALRLLAALQSTRCVARRTMSAAAARAQSAPAA